MPLYASKKDYWTDWAEDARRLGSPLYQQFALGVDGDVGLKALAARARPGQPHANLLLAAVHFLLLRGAQHPLRNYYPTTGGHLTDGDIFAVFRDFVFAHESEIAALIEGRVTNTNEVARSSILRAGFAALAVRETAPLYLIEIGPSAGLNLIWDRYGVRLSQGGAVIAEIAPESQLVLDCEARGPLLPPLTPVPVIAGRVGLELHPVNLSNPNDRDWLRALIWPDQPRRLERFDRAISLFQEDPPPVLGGDALALLPGALAAAPPGAAICVYHSISLYQFYREMKEALYAILTLAGLRRPVWHLPFEFDGDENYALTLARYADGTCDKQLLAYAQSHGSWIEWRAGR